MMSTLVAGQHEMSFNMVCNTRRASQCHFDGLVYLSGVPTCTQSVFLIPSLFSSRLQISAGWRRTMRTRRGSRVAVKAVGVSMQRMRRRRRRRERRWMGGRSGVGDGGGMSVGDVPSSCVYPSYLPQNKPATARRRALATARAAQLGLPSSRARRFRASRNQRNNCPIGTVVHFYLRKRRRVQASTSEQLSW